MRKQFFSLAVLGMVSACSSVPVLKMEASKAPIDDTVTSPAFKFGSLKKLMVISPAGAAAGKYDAVIGTFERELLRGGVTVISGAVTGRVAGDASDVEKALVLAKKSGADAILQLGEWAWTKEAPNRRFFVFDGAKAYKEVSGPEYQASNAMKYGFPSSELRFVGRLIHAETGEVLASFEVKSAANFNLPSTYTAQVEVEKDKPVLKEENFTYANSAWFGDAVKATEVSIVKAVCDRLLHGAPVPATIALTPAAPVGPTAPLIPDAEPKAEDRAPTEAATEE